MFAEALAAETSGVEFRSLARRAEAGTGGAVIPEPERQEQEGSWTFLAS